MADDDQGDVRQPGGSQPDPSTDDLLELLTTARTGVDMSSSDRSGSGRDVFELFATILLALAAIMTAWAGFQAAKWGGVQASSTSQANAARTESVRASTAAGQLATIDVTSFFNWINAIVDEATRGEVTRPENAADYVPESNTLSGFIFERFRPEFRRAMDAWLDTSPFNNPSAPETPFEMPEYQLAAADEAAALLTVAEEQSDAAAAANQSSDNYVISAVLFAGALFFAALSGKLVVPKYKTTALVVATTLFLGTAIYVFTLPLEI